MALASAPGDHASLFEVRPSAIHGLGVFARRRIARGTRIVEYAGERLTADEVEQRYAGEPDTGHTFLFHIGDGLYVDATHQGNDARFINHSCDPNCESEIDGDRVYIVALVDIDPGTELSYDYALEPEDDPPSTWTSLYACRCGTPRCRGTLIDPGSEPPRAVI
jgi:SET domain-containing protein